MLDPRRDGGDAFPMTRWSLVGQGRAGLDELFRLYYPALKVHLTRVKRIAPDFADDVIQGFLASQVIDKDFLERANKDLGKFRTYLLTALDRFLFKQIRDRQAKKRSPQGARFVEIDDIGGAPAAGVQSDLFEAEWARQTLGEAVRLMREECDRGSREDVWQVFERRMLSPLLRHTEPPGYDELVRQLGISSVSQAMNLLVTAKRSFGRAVRQVLSRYANPGEELEMELNDLIRILASSPAAEAQERAHHE